MARETHSVTRVQCGWKFSPRIEIFEYIIFLEEFMEKCPHCSHEIMMGCENQDSNKLDTLCENCWKCIYENGGEVRNNIYNFDVDIMEEKEVEFCDKTVVYKIKVHDFFGIITCVVGYEGNEWSSSPRDIYECTTFLFKNEKECNKEFESLDKVMEYLKY